MSSLPGRDIVPALSVSFLGGINKNTAVQLKIREAQLTTPGKGLGKISPQIQTGL